MKVFINGFRGPWGWINDFETYVSKHRLYRNRIIIVSDVEEADIIFQVDMTNYDLVYRKTSKSKLIMNVLDLAEWVKPIDENGELREYLEIIRKLSNFVTAISPKVIKQLSDVAIKAEMFYYPSAVGITQLKKSHVKLVDKPKMLLSYGRLSDSHKQIFALIDKFNQYNLFDRGWRYVLAGPEKPPFLYKGVVYMGYLNNNDLMEQIRNSVFVLQWSDGEGLGLQPIEASLLGTAFVAKNISPITDLWGGTRSTLISDERMLEIFFSSMKDYDKTCEFVNMQYKYVTDECFNIAFPWTREIAFERLISQLLMWGGCTSD